MESRERLEEKRSPLFGAAQSRRGPAEVAERHVCHERVAGALANVEGLVERLLGDVE